MRSFFLVTTMLVISVIAAFNNTPVRGQSECVQSFHDFAYGGPPLWSQRQTEYALAGWREESPIPSGPENVPVEYPVFAVALSRVFHGEQEIWLSGVGEDGLVWLIYRPASQEWENIPRRIGNTALLSGDLFLTNDGSVWSRTQGYSVPPDTETAPVLSVFNEDTRRFETANVPLEISLRQERDYFYAQPVSPWPIIVLDEQDIFWIIINFDGIYRFDPALRTVKQVIDLPEYPINEAALSKDGIMYFSKPNETSSSTLDLFSLVDGMIFQVDLASGIIETISLPNEVWPVFSGMLVDRDRRLWFGSTGYRDSDETWHLIHPNPEEFFEHAGDHTWSMPQLILESSDGRLWYTRYLDGSGEGTAWYDPVSDDGCLIWGASANVIEDENQRLWMVADEKLYSYFLY